MTMTSHTPETKGPRPIAAASVVGAGLVLAFALERGLGWSSAAHIGDAAAILVASLAGPWWALVAAAVVAVPSVGTPGVYSTAVVAALAAGLLGRLRHFATPAVTIVWLASGTLMQELGLAGAARQRDVLALAGAAMVAALAADTAVLSSAVRRFFGVRVAPRHVASHLAVPFVAVCAGLVVVYGLTRAPFHSEEYPPLALLVASLGTLVAEVAGERIAVLLDRARDGERLVSPDATPDEIHEVRELAETIASWRHEAAAQREALGARLEEREAAYAQLLELSESLEERLHLRGVEVEQRSYLLSLSQRHYREAVEHATDIIFELDLQGRFVSINAAGERFYGRTAASLEGRAWGSTLAAGADAREGFQTVFDALTAEGTYDANTVHVVSEGEIRLLRTELELVRDEEGLPVSVSGRARDVTELTELQQQVGEMSREMQRLDERSRRRLREVNALLGAARVLNSELEIDQLLQHIIESAATYLVAESGFIGLVDDGALSLRWYWRASGASWVDLVGPGVERGVTQIVLETRRPYLCANAHEDPNTDKAFTERFGVRSMLVFPIFSQSSELLGAMALHNFPLADASAAHDDLSLDSSDTRFLEGLADIASAAIQQSRLFDQVRKQAETDPLTGLYNRRAFDERFGLEIERALRFRRSFALILLDIDHLKVVNDTYGHPIGDAAICTVADVLAARMRRHDFAARIGGEEFAVILVEGRADTAGVVARSLLEALRRREVPRAGQVTASLGVAVFPDDAANRDDLFRIADEALYDAKRSGRNRVVVAGDAQRQD